MSSPRSSGMGARGAGDFLFFLVRVYLLRGAQRMFAWGVGRDSWTLSGIFWAARGAKKAALGAS
ncbi:hypothetical protein A2U01_0110082, partial [Trifolium medium]|nr:hypothetical protein [Trifolium medium]